MLAILSQPQCVKSLTHGRCGSYAKSIILKLIIQNSSSLALPTWSFMCLQCPVSKVLYHQWEPCWQCYLTSFFTYQWFRTARLTRRHNWWDLERQVKIFFCSLELIQQKKGCCIHHTIPYSMHIVIYAFYIQQTWYWLSSLPRGSISTTLVVSRVGNGIYIKSSSKFSIWRIK